ncbi:hypothetical protein Nepgr_004020 [Nepenthes gracilis]|uniref:Uncharacterized protein n=1 Tax=Nepenthes gracilis TaxID=150966 RepID=A0AAD3S0T0_NEPGR|nr:hypothetical protein Nepgr_004020 [Nepenthes gracilis]
MNRLEFGWPWWAAGWSNRGQISSAGHSSSSLTCPWYVRFAPRPICLKPLLGSFLAIYNSYRFAPMLGIWLTWLPCLSELDVTHLEALCSPPVEPWLVFEIGPANGAGALRIFEDIFDDLLALKLNGIAKSPRSGLLWACQSVDLGFLLIPASPASRVVLQHLQWPVLWLCFAEVCNKMSCIAEVSGIELGP